MKYSKNLQLSSELLIIDGMWGVGKSVITELLSSFNSLENLNINYLYDYIPNFYSSKSIEHDAAVMLMRNLFDSLTYDMCLSRSVNFRYKDQTSIFNHPKKFQYLKRIIRQEGNESLKQVEEGRMIIPLLTHMSSSNNDFFLVALAGRCKIINCIRHPAFIVKWFSDYLELMAESPRDFVMKIHYKGADIPFFAYGWEEEYLSINNYERAIKSIAVLTNNYNENLRAIKESHGDNSILEISFEEAVLKTDRTLRTISGFINREINQNNFKKVKKKQNLPRKEISSGQKYGAFGFESSKTHTEGIQETTDKKVQSLKSKVTSEYFILINRISREYELKVFKSLL
jgi:hypothetical protein